MTGTSTVLTDGSGAADFLGQGSCRFALVESRTERAFVQRAEDVLDLMSALVQKSLQAAAQIEQRPCGCLLGALGLTTHLSEIRSFEKLTGAGMTFADAVPAMIHIQTAERLRWMERAHELPTFERYPPRA